MSTLAQRECIPAHPDDLPMTEGDAEVHLKELSGWSILEGTRLFRTFDFPDFKTALAFVNRVGALAEDVGHHPDFALGWGRVEIQLWTHDIGGLHMADFILAARIESVL